MVKICQVSVLLPGWFHRPSALISDLLEKRGRQSQLSTEC